MFDLIADDVVLRVRWVAGPPRPSQLGMALVLMPYQSAIEESDRNHIRNNVSVRLPIPRLPSPSDLSGQAHCQGYFGRRSPDPTRR